MKRLMMVLVLAGCGAKDEGSGDGDDGDTTDPLAGVVGKYNFIPGAATGCTVGSDAEAVSENFWVVDWLSGMLKIDGTPDDLTYLFPLGGEAGYEFAGGMLDDQSFNMYGSVIFEGVVDRQGLEAQDVMADLALVGTGDGENTGGCWSLSGMISVNVDEDDNDLDADDCTLEVPFQASQLDGATCDGAL